MSTKRLRRRLGRQKTITPQASSRRLQGAFNTSLPRLMFAGMLHKPSKEKNCSQILLLVKILKFKHSIDRLYKLVGKYRVFFNISL